MANSVMLTNLSNRLKNKVSKQKKRYTDDGFDLDLTYINDNLIAMGFPAEKTCERMYRNSIDDVLRFFEKKHGPDYKIYNLCSEKSYDYSKFRRYSCFPFDDHNPPTIELIQDFCKDVQQFLCENVKHVAAVHCKAGKGRTGTMICCYLLHDRQFTKAEEALNFYGQQRTYDKNGVTIPSQRRYVEYYARLLNDRLPYEHIRLQILEIHLISPPPGAINMEMVRIFFAGQRFHSELVKVSQNSATNANTTTTNTNLTNPPADDQHIVLQLCQPVVARAECQIQFYHKPSLKPKEKLFHFWFNTFFVNLSHNQVAANGVHGSEEDSTITLTLTKSEIDLAHKDKQNKIPSDFKIKVVFKRDDSDPPELNNSLNNNSSICNSNLQPFDYQQQQPPQQQQQAQPQQQPSNRVVGQNNHHNNHLLHMNNSSSGPQQPTTNNVNNNNHNNHHHHHHHRLSKSGIVLNAAAAHNNHQHAPLLMSHSSNSETNDEELMSLGSLNNGQARQTSCSDSSTEEDGWESDVKSSSNIRDESMLLSSVDDIEGGDQNEIDEEEEQQQQKQHLEDGNNVEVEENEVEPKIRQISSTPPPPPLPTRSPPVQVRQHTDSSLDESHGQLLMNINDHGCSRPPKISDPDSNSTKEVSSSNKMKTSTC